MEKNNTIGSVLFYSPQEIIYCGNSILFNFSSTIFPGTLA